MPKLIKAIQAEDRAAADALLASLDVQNLYEDAFLNVGKYEHYRRWGTEAEQIASLRRAVAGENHARYLPKETFLSALQVLPEWRR